MKSLTPILVLASALLLGGCATPLSVTKDSGRFAEALGIATNEVLFLSYGTFDKSPKGPKPSFRENPVVVVATRGLLHIIHEKVPKNTEPKHMSVKYSEMQSIARRTQGFASELQMESEDYIMLLHIIPNKLTGDRKGSKTLFDLITAKGVRVAEANQGYFFKGGGGMAPISIGPFF